MKIKRTLRIMCVPLLQRPMLYSSNILKDTWGSELRHILQDLCYEW